LFDSFFRRVLE